MSVDDMPGMWEPSDLSGGWADTTDEEASVTEPIGACPYCGWMHADAGSLARRRRQIRACRLRYQVHYIRQRLAMKTIWWTRWARDDQGNLLLGRAAAEERAWKSRRRRS